MCNLEKLFTFINNPWVQSEMLLISCDQLWRDMHLLNSELKYNFLFHSVNVSSIKGVWEQGQCHSHTLGHTYKIIKLSSWIGQSFIMKFLSWSNSTESYPYCMLSAINLTLIIQVNDLFDVQFIRYLFKQIFKN